MVTYQGMRLEYGTEGRRIVADISTDRGQLEAIQSESRKAGYPYDIVEVPDQEVSSGETFTGKPLSGYVQEHPDLPSSVQRGTVEYDTKTGIAIPITGNSQQEIENIRNVIREKPNWALQPGNLEALQDRLSKTTLTEAQQKQELSNLYRQDLEAKQQRSALSELYQKDLFAKQEAARQQNRMFTFSIGDLPGSSNTQFRPSMINQQPLVDYGTSKDTLTFFTSPDIEAQKLIQQGIIKEFNVVPYSQMPKNIVNEEGITVSAPFGVGNRNTKTIFVSSELPSTPQEASSKGWLYPLYSTEEGVKAHEILHFKHPEWTEKQIAEEQARMVKEGRYFSEEIPFITGEKNAGDIIRGFRTIPSELQTTENLKGVATLFAEKIPSATYKKGESPSIIGRVVQAVGGKAAPTAYENLKENIKSSLGGMAGISTSSIVDLSPPTNRLNNLNLTNINATNVYQQGKEASVKEIVSFGLTSAKNLGSSVVSNLKEGTKRFFADTTSPSFADVLYAKPGSQSPSEVGQAVKSVLVGKPIVGTRTTIGVGVLSGKEKSRVVERNVADESQPDVLLPRVVNIVPTSINAGVQTLKSVKDIAVEGYKKVSKITPQDIGAAYFATSREIQKNPAGVAKGALLTGAVVTGNIVKGTAQSYAEAPVEFITQQAVLGAGIKSVKAGVQGVAKGTKFAMDTNLNLRINAGEQSITLLTKNSPTDFTVRRYDLTPKISELRARYDLSPIVPEVKAAFTPVSPVARATKLAEEGKIYFKMLPSEDYFNVVESTGISRNALNTGKIIYKFEGEQGVKPAIFIRTDYTEGLSKGFSKGEGVNMFDIVNKNQLKQNQILRTNQEVQTTTAEELSHLGKLNQALALAEDRLNVPYKYQPSEFLARNNPYALRQNVKSGTVSLISKGITSDILPSVTQVVAPVGLFQGGAVASGDVIGMSLNNPFARRATKAQLSGRGKPIGYNPKSGFVSGERTTQALQLRGQNIPDLYKKGTPEGLKSVTKYIQKQEPAIQYTQRIEILKPLKEEKSLTIINQRGTEKTITSKYSQQLIRGDISTPPKNALVGLKLEYQGGKKIFYPSPGEIGTNIRDVLNPPEPSTAKQFKPEEFRGNIYLSDKGMAFATKQKEINLYKPVQQLKNIPKVNVEERALVKREQSINKDSPIGLVKQEPQPSQAIQQPKAQGGFRRGTPMEALRKMYQQRLAQQNFNLVGESYTTQFILPPQAQELSISPNAVPSVMQESSKFLNTKVNLNMISGMATNERVSNAARISNLQSKIFKTQQLSQSALLQKQSSKLEQLNTPIVSTDISQRIMPITRQDVAQSNIIINAQDVGIMTAQDQMTAQQNLLDTQQDVVTIQKLDLLTPLITTPETPRTPQPREPGNPFRDNQPRPRDPFRDNPPRDTFREQPLEEPKPKKFATSDEGIKKSKQQKKSDLSKRGYDVYIKSKQTKLGKGRYKSKGFYKANESPLTLEAAKGLGADVVDTYTNRSFTVRPAKGNPVSRPDLESKWNALQSKFRYAKKNASVFVEKNLHNIDSPQEKAGIPYESLKTRKALSRGIARTLQRTSKSYPSLQPRGRVTSAKIPSANIYGMNLKRKARRVLVKANTPTLINLASASNKRGLQWIK